MKNETRSGPSVPTVSLRIGRTSLRANRGSTALASPESKLTRDIAGSAHGMQTDRMSGPSKHVVETPQKGSATERTRVNQALQTCLDRLTSVAELDDFLGEMMAAMTRQLGAVSSTLRMRNFEQNTLPLEFVFQEGRATARGEAKYPECRQSESLEPFDPDLLYRPADKRTRDEQPAAIIRVLEPHSPMPDDQRSYLRELGVKPVLILPLASRGPANGRLTFRFTEERDFEPEELEIARALATQARLAIHLTRLAQAARQAAILEDRNQLAGEIHDSLAQSFAGIAMKLAAAEEGMDAGEGSCLRQVRLAHKVAEFGLADARRFAMSLQSTALKEPGLIEALQTLAERSNVVGRLRCDFRSSCTAEESLPASIRHGLLRIAQEAISNASRHGKPTVVTVSLRWEPPNLMLQIKDNGSGIPATRLVKREGMGLRSMRERAAQIGAKLVIRTSPRRGTRVIVTVPISR